jgi:site-specific recombinase XerD
MTIPEPQFYLKDILSKVPTSIYFQARYSYNGPQRVMISTGDKILPADWDSVKKRAVVSKKNPAHSDINTLCDKYVNVFKSVMRNCAIDGIAPQASVIREKMEKLLRPALTTDDQKVLNLVEFIDRFIKDTKGLKSPNTIKSYVSTYNRFKQHCVLCNKQFNFDDINLSWRSSFLQFLQKGGVNRNTEGKHIKNIKVFMNEAIERKLTTNVEFRSKSFSKPNEEVDKIFLSMEEIAKIAQLDLSKEPLKDVVRDYFVISCLTSLRYSDFIRIKPENIIDNQIQLKTSKTGQEVIIPISPLVRAIFEKYDFNLPTAPGNQVFNRYLKDIGSKAEIDEVVTVTETVGGVKKVDVYKKWELISSHTGRRSLISNCILQGINTSSIMLISGHKSLKVFQGYVRINQKQNAEALGKHEFFN